MYDFLLSFAYDSPSAVANAIVSVGQDAVEWGLAIATRAFALILAVSLLKFALWRSN